MNKYEVCPLDFFFGLLMYIAGCLFAVFVSIVMVEKGYSLELRVFYVIHALCLAIAGSHMTAQSVKKDEMYDCPN